MRLVLRVLIVAVGLLVGAVPAAAETWVTIQNAAPPGDVPGPMGFASAGATIAPGDTAVFYGGQTDVVSAATWKYHAGGTWTAVCGTTAPPGPACGPGPRVGHGMGTVPGGAALYGGIDEAMGSPTATAYGDTWVFDGSTWSQVCTEVTCGPGARVGHAMAGNGTVAVMFGGTGGSGLIADTWVFDGATWTAVCGTSSPPTPACGPSARVGATLVWDGARFVLVAGSDGGAYTADTWSFDPGGGTWSQECIPCGPTGRAYAFGAALLSSVRPGAVVAGGMELGDPPSLWDDVWFWDATARAWEELAVPWITEGGPFPSTEQGVADVCGMFLPSVASQNDWIMLFGSVGGPSPYPDYTAMGWDISGNPFEPCGAPTTTTTVPATTTTAAPATSTTSAETSSTTAASGVSSTTAVGIEGAPQSATPSGRLPSTGAPVLAVGLIGLAALGAGLLARRLGRNRAARG